MKFYICIVEKYDVEDTYLDLFDNIKNSNVFQTKSPCEKVIRRDIARTYPEHDFFKEKDGLGQESLFNVIKAYSLYDREVGYCQGSGFIVGLLLMQVVLTKNFHYNY